MWEGGGRGVFSKCHVTFKKNAEAIFTKAMRIGKAFGISSFSGKCTGKADNRNMDSSVHFWYRYCYQKLDCFGSFDNYPNYRKCTKVFGLVLVCFTGKNTHISDQKWSIIHPKSDQNTKSCISWPLSVLGRF